MHKNGGKRQSQTFAIRSVELEFLPGPCVETNFYAPPAGDHVIAYFPHPCYCGRVCLFVYYFEQRDTNSL